MYQIVNREKPLALYVFSNKKNLFELFKSNTSSGSFAFNEVLMQISCKIFVLFSNKIC